MNREFLSIEPYDEPDTVEQFVKYIGGLVSRKHAPKGRVRELSEELVKYGMAGYADACATYKRDLKHFPLYAFLFVRHRMLEHIKGLKVSFEYEFRPRRNYRVRFSFMPLTQHMSYSVSVKGQITDGIGLYDNINASALGSDGLPTQEFLREESEWLATELLTHLAR